MDPMDELRPINNSQVKAWRRCRRAWWYKYDQLLVPKAKRLPLYKGSWVHACLETHYKQGDWKVGYNLYLAEYNKLPQEAQVELSKGRSGRPGTPLPQIVKRIMLSYLWYNKAEGWSVYAVEKTFDFVFHGVRFKGTIDLIVQDEEGFLWVIDHKTTSSIPTASSFHAMDPQLQLYPWAAKQAWGLEIAGIIWNYVKSSPPSVPKMTKAGRISRSKVVTDYPTMVRFLKDNGFDPADFSDILRPLRKQSPFLRRYKMPRERQVTKTIIQEYLVTAREIYSRPPITRSITKECVQCDYVKLCQGDLNGMDTTSLRRSDYDIEDVTIKHGDYDSTESENYN